MKQRQWFALEKQNAIPKAFYKATCAVLPRDFRREAGDKQPQYFDVEMQNAFPKAFCKAKCAVLPRDSLKLFYVQTCTHNHVVVYVAPRAAHNCVCVFGDRKVLNAPTHNAQQKKQRREDLVSLICFVVRCASCRRQGLSVFTRNLQRSRGSFWRKSLDWAQCFHLQNV